MKVLFVKGLFGRTERRVSLIDKSLHLTIPNTKCISIDCVDLGTCDCCNHCNGLKTCDIPGQDLENGYELA